MLLLLIWKIKSGPCNYFLLSLALIINCGSGEGAVLLTHCRIGHTAVAVLCVIQKIYHSQLCMKSVQVCSGKMRKNKTEIQ